MRLVVVGAGIAGLAAAYEARRLAEREGEPLELAILEADTRAGGKIWTEQVDGAALEWGPDSLVASKPAARELAADLGLDLIVPSPLAKRAYLLIDGELRPFPAGTVMGVPRGVRAIAAALQSGIVSLRGAFRASAEPFLPGRPRDEPVSAALRGRLGREWATRLVEPLVQGVYGASADELGMEAALPQFAGARSLSLAARNQSTPRGSAFLSIRGGMQRLVDRLVECVGTDLRLSTLVSSVERSHTEFLVRTDRGDVSANGVIVAVPAPIASKLFASSAPNAAVELARIRFSASFVVQMRFDPHAIGRKLDGSGYLVGPDERLAHAACSWMTTKWPQDIDAVWLRAIVTDPIALRREQQVLAGRVADEVRAVIGASSPPTHVMSHHWVEALPVYDPGHPSRVATIERTLPEGIAVAGASYRGVGVPDCITSGREAARHLAGPKPGRPPG